SAAGGNGRPPRTTVNCMAINRWRYLSSSADGAPLFEIAPDCRLQVGLLQQVLERRQRFDDKEHLIREQPGRQRDQPLVDPHYEAAQDLIAEHQRERPRNPSGGDDAEAPLVEQLAERSKREEPCVRDVENAPLSVVELAQQQHETVDEESD